ncbi:MAG: Transcriptional regulator [Berkelbacteria bacterium GW2011_GWA2_38_9]|uniref:Transcriptional regulator n=1 Tax=Berkelbacteria bacterium GW2011_GWA2_38_9 TaxID=1618334 RepID=A0A0G0NVY0_9BACT|nr:MAG: Transcriptional regulator [Berkelbacteria bacterium GW2011_GWA2_38_9]
MKQKFEKYSTESIHFLNDTPLPAVLEFKLKETRQKKPAISLLDLGSGDGAWIHSMLKRNLINFEHDQITASDLSVDRLNATKQFLPQVKTVQSDACHIDALPDKQFDVILCTMLIEHVDDDRELLKEIRRLLKDDGWAYVTTVVKKWYGLYIYRNNGHIVLDPTHVREYPSLKKFVQLEENAGFKINRYKQLIYKFQLSDLFFRLLVKLKILKPKSLRTIYMKNPWKTIRNLFRIPILGFYVAETIIQSNRSEKYKRHIL